MKYYLIKSVNNIPFIFGQFDSEEEAIEALRNTPRQPLVSYEVVCNIEDREDLQQELDHNMMLLETTKNHIERLLQDRSVLVAKNENYENAVSELLEVNSCLREQLIKCKNQLAYQKKQFQKLMDSI